MVATSYKGYHLNGEKGYLPTTSHEEHPIGIPNKTRQIVAANPPRAWKRSDAAATPEELPKASYPKQGKEIEGTSPVLNPNHKKLTSIPISPRICAGDLLRRRLVHGSSSNKRAYQCPCRRATAVLCHARRSEKVEVVDVGGITASDFGKLTIQMTGDIKKNVIDPYLTAWIMPDFTTTTHTDMVTAAVLMMGVLQEYFKYTFTLACAVPSVTFLGKREDWEPGQFYTLVGRRARLSLLSPEVQSFWSRMVNWQGGSGIHFFLDWITAFTFWKTNGEYLSTLPQGPVGVSGLRNVGCHLDGTLFHIIDMKDIPDAFYSVPVTVDDNGTIHKMRMVAGF
ncbi:uncharacterized protein F4812DRAFT_467741 [Daldinia caldariorum]|uniref:uncharacterized protein n=1 Tax=Daldinia caldariorum TaxID=326644 RepID=UPI00200804B6|nr:uncharacterized protein F4812DRAFT_467741 [Daldinia caldariorum]KAI1471817.1 hypothetical protein F4812DRAFT_467741 [Daldinia caldariorum]